MTTARTDAPYVNLLDPEFYVEPFEAYRWLRDHAPAYWDPVQRIWGISRHADVLAVEKNARLYTSWNGSRPHLDMRDETSMINKDDPDHQRQRSLVVRRFTPRAVNDHEQHVRGIVTELIDAIEPQGECEVIETLASRLPAIVIGEALGYPREMWVKVREWSELTMHGGGQTPADGKRSDVFPSSPQTSGAMLDFANQTIPLIAARRAEPRDDLLSVWTHSETDGRPWTDAEVLAECILVLDGGAETTRTVIGSIIRELALRPDQRRLLREHPEMIRATAVDEFIRWVSPILNMRRTVTEDHELHGEQLHEGDEVLLMYSSANRDEREFDDPDTFDVTRAANHHVAFGIGTHFCLGAALARLEIRVMFEELLRRIPNWELTGPEPRIRPATFARGHDAVHIAWPTTPGTA